MTLSRWATPRNFQTSSAFSSHSTTFWVESPLNSGISRSSIALSTIVSRNSLLAIRKCDKQQRSLHSRFNIHSSHKYIYSLRSQQSVSQCHNTSPNSSHYPWQHANIPVSEPHLSQASTYRVSHKQLGKFMLSFDLLCSQSVYKSPCLPQYNQLGRTMANRQETKGGCGRRGF